MVHDSGRWSVDFYDFYKESSVPIGVEWFGDVWERAARNGARHGTPVLIPPSGWPDARVNLFFRTGSMAAASTSTMRRYAYSLAVWFGFLGVFDRDWDSATVGDVEAFKDWRLTDVRNDGRVAPTSLDRDLVALNTFYRWASMRYAVVNPVPTVSAAGSRRRSRLVLGGGVTPARSVRNPLRPAGSNRRQVKWLLRSAFEQWRDIGLRGYGFDGERSAGWRGFNEDRDVAFVDGLYGTGLRLREWASIVDVELPVDDSGRYPRARLASACGKGGRGRDYRIPRRALAAVIGYMDPIEGSRAEVVRRAQRAGRYERLPNTRIVTGYNVRSRVLLVEGPSGAAPLALDVCGPDERRHLFRWTPDGLEPLAVWLGVNGLPKKPQGWEDTFADANARIAAAWTRTATGDSSGSRPGVDSVCPLWARPHMLRHSFALKWFSILSAVWEVQLDGFTSEELKDLRDQIGDIWYRLSILLGHADPSTTRDYYLEPFTGLQLDYLMALLDEDEHAAISSTLRAIAADGGLVLRGTAPLPDQPAAR